MRVSALSLGAGALVQFIPVRASAKASGKPFRIVQLSDTHVGFQGPPDPLGTTAFEHAVDVINGLHPQPDLILFTGDLTHDSEDPAEHAKRFAKFRSIEDRLRVKKRLHVPGEHDAALDGGALFRENFGDTNYSFDHRGMHFIAIDNVSRGKPIVGADQIAWLKNDLSRYPTSAPIVVFTHRPLFNLKPEWEWFTRDGADVMNVLAPYESVTVLYGHIHREHHFAQHHAARSLIFAFPDPATVAEKKPLPFDSAQPFRNLGLRRIDASNKQLAINDIELSMTEVAGTEGVAQMLKELA